MYKPLLVCLANNTTLREINLSHNQLCTFKHIHEIECQATDDGLEKQVINYFKEKNESLEKDESMFVSFKQVHNELKSMDERKFYKEKEHIEDEDETNPNPHVVVKEPLEDS